MKWPAYISWGTVGGLVKSLSGVRLFVILTGSSPWDSPGKNTGVSCHFLLQGIFLTQGLNPGLLHCRRILYPLSLEMLIFQGVGVWRVWLRLHMRQGICVYASETPLGAGGSRVESTGGPEPGGAPQHPGKYLWTDDPTCSQPSRASLVIQWLWHHASAAEGAGSIPGQGTKSLHAVQPSQINKWINTNKDVYSVVMI